MTPIEQPPNCDEYRENHHESVSVRSLSHPYAVGQTLPPPIQPNVAIDGPAGAGKTTVAQCVADMLGYRYIDTGSMYRAVTWKALETGFGPDDWARKDALQSLAESLSIEYRLNECNQLRVFIEGVDRSEELRSSAVESYVSLVASVSGVRRALVGKQQELAREGGIVMDGRDIGTHVLVDAPVKIFLSAALPVRVERRLRQKWVEGSLLSWEESQASVENRDRIDSTREDSPLRPAEDAIIIDSTFLDKDDVVRQIVSIVDGVNQEATGGSL